MGFLGAGAPLSWEATARYGDVVKRRGVREFLQLHKQYSADAFPLSTLSWGDEVEYCLLNLDVDNKVARLYLGAEDVLRELKTREGIVTKESYRNSECHISAPVTSGPEPPPPELVTSGAAVSAKPSQGSASSSTSLSTAGSAAAGVSPSKTLSTEAEDAGETSTTIRARFAWQTSSWHPEYGTHMVEAIPGTVYPLRLDSILDLLPSMQMRRKKVQAVLPLGCYIASLGSFPLMGAPEYHRRPHCCCLCSSPSSRPLRAARCESTPLCLAGADGKSAELAASENTRCLYTRGVSSAGFPAARHRYCAVGVIAEVDTRAVADSRAAAGATLHARATTMLQPHASEEIDVFIANEKAASSDEMMLLRDLFADAEGKGAVFTKEPYQDETYEESKISTDREGQALHGRSTAPDGKKDAGYEHLQATTLRAMDGREGRAAAAVATQELDSTFLSLVGPTTHTGNFAYPSAVPHPCGSLSRSLFVGDALINPHPRFGTLTANIRKRRNKKAEILIPLFVDERTALPPAHRSVSKNTATLTRAETLGAREGCPRNALTADKVDVTHDRILGDKGVAGGDIGGAAGEKDEDGETEAQAITARADVREARVAVLNSEEEQVHSADGASKGCPKTSADEPCPEEEIYKQLMLEGKILHDGRFIYMDAMGFGMGMHCVQGTFGCPSMGDARYLYDQLAILAPLWLSLSAATPFMRGLLAAVDSRWDVIAACVDCRTDAEKCYIPKSRYGTISLYIGEETPLTEHLSFYNDVRAPVNERAFAALVENGVDEILARHVAFLFVREPLVIFEDKLLAHSFARKRNRSGIETGLPSSPTQDTSRESSALTAAPRATCASASHSSPGARTLPHASVVRAESPDILSAAPTTSALSCASRASSVAPYATASNPVLPPQVAHVQEEEGPDLQIEKRKEHEERDALLIAEAKTPWGFDDGVLYTTTEDFENLQSTNWNSVRFKPPGAFKPTAAPGMPQALAQTCREVQNASLSESAVDSIIKGRTTGRRSNIRRWSSGSNVSGRRRRFFSKNSVVADASTVVSGGWIPAERVGTSRSEASVVECESIRDVRITSATNTLNIADAAGFDECDIRNPHSIAAAAWSSAEVQRVAASAFGKVGRRRHSQGAGNVKGQAERGEMASPATTFHRIHLSTPAKTSSSASFSLASSLTAFSPSSTSPSGNAAADDSCAAPWRVEFRTPDVQLTDFENAACLSLVSVLVQVILEERLDFYIPMSLNDENTRRAVACNSILRQKFWFRNDIRRGTPDRSFAEFSLHQILFGTSRVSETSPTSVRTAASSSTPLLRTPPCRFSFSSCSSSCSATPCSAGSPPVYSPFLSSTSHSLPYPSAPSLFSSSSHTRLVAHPAPQQPSSVPPPVSTTAARSHLTSSPQPVRSLPPHIPPWLPHTHAADVDGKFSDRASSTVAERSVSPWSAASAPPAFPVWAPAGGDSDGSFPGHGHSCPIGASPSVSCVSSGVSPPLSPIVGLVPLALRYIEKQLVAGRCSREAAAQYLEYFDYLRHRTEGLLPTDASFLRACLAVHPAYKQDSVISPPSCFDLCRLAVRLGLGELQIPELFGPFAGRAGMRISAESCCFDNGVPVVTSYFLSRFVSDAFKEALRGHFTEASDSCWQQKRKHLCACWQWGATDGGGGAVEGEKQQMQEKINDTAAAGITAIVASDEEKKGVQTTGGLVATSGHQMDSTTALHQGRTRYYAGKSVIVEAAHSAVSRVEDAATKGCAGVDTGIALTQEGHARANLGFSEGEGSGSDGPQRSGEASCIHAAAGRKEWKEQAQGGEAAKKQLPGGGANFMKNSLSFKEAQESTGHREMHTESRGQLWAYSGKKTEFSHELSPEEFADKCPSKTATIEADRTSVWSVSVADTLEEEKVLSTEARGRTSELLARLQAAVTCTRPSTAAEVTGNNETSEAPVTGRSHLIPTVTIPIFCRSTPPRADWDGKASDCHENTRSNNCTEKTGNNSNASEPGKRRDFFCNDENPDTERDGLREVYEEGDKEEKVGRAIKPALSYRGKSTVCRESEESVGQSFDYTRRLDICALAVPKECILVDSMSPTPRFAQVGKEKKGAVWNVGEPVAAPDNAGASGRSQEAECKADVAAPCRILPDLTAVLRSVVGEAECSCGRSSCRGEKADRRIAAALSGTAAASLCSADAASKLRNYMLEPTCSGDTSSPTGVAPAVAGGFKKRSCGMYSGWPACTSVGVTNEEATERWIYLTSGFHYSRYCDDSGSTSCPSTDDDRESADEVSDAQKHEQRMNCKCAYEC